MTKFLVEIVETVYYEITIEAETIEEIHIKFNNGELEWGEKDYIDSTDAFINNIDEDIWSKEE